MGLVHEQYGLFPASRSRFLRLRDRIRVELLEGYRYAQVFAPKGEEYVALEPMTAPTNALTTGAGLQIVKPGGRVRTEFRVCVETLS